MIRFLPALVLAFSTGCMPLDGLFFNPTVTDAYALRTDIIPESAIEQVSFPSLDGTVLSGVWAHQDPPAPPLIFFHGNGGNIELTWDRAEAYWAWGRNDVFLVDYRGYGTSEGTPSYDGVIEQDGLATVQFVAEASGLPPEQIRWIGHSLGASVATHTNDEIGAESVVLESMFASAGHLIDDGTGLDLPAGWFFDDPFDNVAAIPDLQSPLFLIHGLDDDYILASYLDELFAAAPDPKERWTPEGVNHGDILEVMPEEYQGRVTSFQDAFAR